MRFKQESWDVYTMYTFRKHDPFLNLCAYELEGSFWRELVLIENPSTVLKKIGSRRNISLLNVHDYF